MSRRWVELNGGRQASYEAIGSGPPLLMFPGGPGGNAAYVRPQAELLADRFTAYLIDPHGSGGSTRPADPAEYGFEGHARVYDEGRRALGIERASVYGFSFGGGVALVYAALHPRATELCFCVSFGGSREGASVTEERERALARHASAPWYQEARAALDGAIPEDVDALLRT
ncbi:MAG: alpha/beta fold hydrolase [Gaiellaceae bacterium]